MDEDLQRELDEALGDMSLMDIMEAEEAPAASSQPEAEGVRRGKVIAIHGDDIFVDMGVRQWRQPWQPTSLQKQTTRSC